MRANSFDLIEGDQGDAGELLTVEQQQCAGDARIVECAHPPEAIQPSTCAGVHDHGHPPVNSANRRMIRSRDATIDSPSRRDCCCVRQPVSIDSNSAGSTRSGVAPVTNVNAAEPATR
jgi:hypothetical protein